MKTFKTYKMNLIIFGIVLIICGMIAVGVGLYHKNSNDKNFACQFSGKEWTELTGFKDVKSAREYLNKNSEYTTVTFSDNKEMPIGSPSPVEKLRITGTGQIETSQLKVYPEGFRQDEEGNIGIGDSKFEISSVAPKILDGRDKGIFSKPYNHYHFEEQCYKPYKVEVKDEHRVILTADNDTISLYLENATRLEEETIIYILPINQ